eukprot:gene26101-biopygen13995
MTGTFAWTLFVGPYSLVSHLFPPPDVSGIAFSQANLVEINCAGELEMTYDEAELALKEAGGDIEKCFENFIEQ